MDVYEYRQRKAIDVLINYTEFPPNTCYDCHFFINSEDMTLESKHIYQPGLCKIDAIVDPTKTWAQLHETWLVCNKHDFLKKLLEIL